MIKRISFTLFSLFLVILILTTPVLAKDPGKGNSGVPFQELWEEITALRQQVEEAIAVLQQQVEAAIVDLQQQIDNIPPRYTDEEAIAAMGELADDNTLNHNRYTDEEAQAALGFHTSDTDIHYTGDDLTKTRISYGEWTLSSHTHVPSSGTLTKIPFNQPHPKIGLLPGFNIATSVFTALVNGVYNINAILFTSSDPPNGNLREVSIVINNDRFNGPALYLPPIPDYDHPLYINWTGALRQDDEVYIAIKQISEEGAEESSEEEEEYLTISSAGTKLCITKLSNLDLSKVKEEESSEEESEE